MRPAELSGRLLSTGAKSSHELIGELKEEMDWEVEEVTVIRRGSAQSTAMAPAACSSTDAEVIFKHRGRVLEGRQCKLTEDNQGHLQMFQMRQRVGAVLPPRIHGQVWWLRKEP